LLVGHISTPQRIEPAKFPSQSRNVGLRIGEVAEMRAFAGQVVTQIGWRSSTGSSRSWMRSTHSVHFLHHASTSSNSRAPYGQAQAQSLQPMHLS